MNSRLWWLQEIIMIPTIIFVIISTFKLRDDAFKIIAFIIVLCQMFVHIKMLIKPFRCNPNQGKICNVYALLAGLMLFLVFMKTMCVDKQISVYTVVPVLAALYSIVSHIVYIPMSAIMYKIIASR